MPTYDKHYQEPNYFGDPYPELVAFFSEYKPKGRVLDLGCGQGRDSIALARMGYSVTGVDISKVGVLGMLSVAKAEKLDVTGIVADMYGYKVDTHFDIVLMDSILHFYKPDKKRETELLNRIMNELRVGGLLCIVVWKSQKIEFDLENALAEAPGKWFSIFDRYIRYPEKDMDMRMIALKKHKVKKYNEF